MQEKEISQQLVYEGKIYRVWQARVRLPSGLVASREYLEHIAGSVSAVVLDENLNIYLVKEFRSAVKEIQTHLPGGTFDLQKETPEEAIVREVREEIGKRPQKVEKLFEFYGGGSWLWPQYSFFCTELLDDPLKGDWDEKVEVIKRPFKQCLSEVLEDRHGRFGDFKAIILTAKKLGLLKIKI